MLLVDELLQLKIGFFSLNKNDNKEAWIIFLIFLNVKKYYLLSKREQIIRMQAFLEMSTFLPKRGKERK